jgi:hypothetical protein
MKEHRIIEGRSCLHSLGLLFTLTMEALIVKIRYTSGTAVHANAGQRRRLLFLADGATGCEVLQADDSGLPSNYPRMDLD